MGFVLFLGGLVPCASVLGAQTSGAPRPTQGPEMPAEQATSRAAPTSLGPLRTSEQNPLYRLLGVPEVESSDPVGEGALRVDFSTSYSNVFEGDGGRDYTHLFDLEQMTNSLTVRYGVRPSVEVGAGIGLYTSWGGFLDPAVSGFHRVFGLPNGGRGQRPEGEHRFYLAREALPSDEVVFDLPTRTLALEEARLFAKWQALGARESASALSLYGAMRRAGGPLESGRLDGSVAVLGRFSAAPVHLHGALGLTKLTPPDELAPITKDYAIYFLGAFERSFRPGLALVVQLVGSTSYITGIDSGDLHGIPTNLTVGFEGLTAGGWGWQVSFAEDILFGGPSVDFTFDFELSRTFTRAREARPIEP